VLAQQNVEVRAENGYLWVQANNASAIELADEISQTLGINVVITGDTETRINLDIVEEPVERALSRLSPNNMLVRGGDDPDSDITEVILMMGEGGSGAVQSSQFLPTGSPAEPVETQQPSQQLDAANAAVLRDPNRAAAVREAAATATNDANLPPGQVPPMFAEDQLPSDGANFVIIDPETGLPVGDQ